MTGLAMLDADSLWGTVLAAAAGSHDQPARTVARLCHSAGSPRLGWVRPAPWRVVRRAVSAVRSALGAPQTVLLGTGGWSFAAQALCETVGGTSRLVPLDSLDCAAIQAVLDPGPARRQGFLAVSGSGTTLETCRLADVVAAGCARRLVWLQDGTAPPATYALSAHGTRDHVAMLGAPLSMAFLVAADAVDGAALAAVYPRLLRRYRRLGASAARRAVAVAVSGDVRVGFTVPRWAGPGLRRWLLQLGRQVLCGKSDRFRASVEVYGFGERRGHTDAHVDFGTLRRGLAQLMDLFYVAGVFVACVGLRAGIEVAEHPHVHAYKDLVAQADPDRVPARPVAAEDLPALAAAWLAPRTDLDTLHVVRYWSAAPPAALDAGRFCAATGRRCEVHEGSAWNHHSFQAVYADPRVGVLLVTRPPGAEGRTPATLATAERTLSQITVATHRALPDRSLLARLVTAAGPGTGGG